MPTLDNLPALLDPLSERDFFERYWEAAPLVVNRRRPKHYDNLFPLNALDEVFARALEHAPATVEVFGGADERDAGDKALEANNRPDDLESVRRAYRAGATLRIAHVQRYWPPLQTLCAELEQRFSFPVKANLYCTPRAARGLDRHHDTHDVLVLQLAGRKHWRVFSPVAPLPLERRPPLESEVGEVHQRVMERARASAALTKADEHDNTAPAHEATLEAGDLLYLPRGFPHEARTPDDEESVHLTVGVHVITWMDLLSTALGQVSARDERFRKALPVGFARESNAARETEGQFGALLDALASAASAAEASEELGERFVLSRRAIEDAPPTSSEAQGDAPDIDARTLMRRRPGLVCRLAVAEQGVGLVAQGRALWMPPAFAQALRLTVERAEFRVSDFPGRMSERSKISLARRLMSEGFLVVADADGGEEKLRR